MRKISEQECLKNLIGGIDCISKYHRHNKVWCCNQSNWNEKEYGWTNPLFPPEYQKACLNGTEFVPESTCDLYFFMIGDASFHISLAPSLSISSMTKSVSS